MSISYVLCSADKPGKPNPPCVNPPYYTYVTVTYEAPANVDSSKVIKYRVKYRKLEDGEWKATPETSNLTQTVSNLEANSNYVLRVSAKYEDKQLGPESDCVTFTTTEDVGKCCACVLETLKPQENDIQEK